MHISTYKVLVTLAMLTLATHFVTGGAKAQVTTNTYSASSTSKEIDKSCKDLSLDTSTAVVSGKCNYSASGGVTTKSTSWDLDNNLGCKDGVLHKEETNVSSVATAFSCCLNSTGTAYLFGARCHYASNRSGMDLDDILKNDKGSLADD